MSTVPGELLDEVTAALTAGQVDRVVLDLRHNGGGNNAHYRPRCSPCYKTPA